MKKNTIKYNVIQKAVLMAETKIDAVVWRFREMEERIVKLRDTEQYKNPASQAGAYRAYLKRNRINNISCQVRGNEVYLVKAW